MRIFVPPFYKFGLIPSLFIRAMSGFGSPVASHSIIRCDPSFTETCEIGFLVHSGGTNHVQLEFETVFRGEVILAYISWRAPKSEHLFPLGSSRCMCSCQHLLDWGDESWELKLHLWGWRLLFHLFQEDFRSCTTRTEKEESLPRWSKRWSSFLRSSNCEETGTQVFVVPLNASINIS